MGCSTSDIEIQAIHKQVQSSIGKLNVEVIKFQLSTTFFHRFQKLSMVKFSVSNQEHILSPEQLARLTKCNKNSFIDFSYVINSLKKKYGRLLIIQVIAQKNGQLTEITQIIDINPVIKLSIQQQFRVRSYLNFQKQCLGTLDLNLTFFEKPSSNVHFQLSPIFNSQIHKLEGQFKFSLTAGQQYIQKSIQLHSNNTKRFQSKIQIPHFLNKIQLKAQYIDQNSITHLSTFPIEINVQALLNAQIQQILDLTIMNNLTIGKILIKQSISQKSSQNTTNSSKQIVSLQKIKGNIEASTMPTENQIISTKEMICLKKEIKQTSFKTPKKVLLPPIQSKKEEKEFENKIYSQNIINLCSKKQKHQGGQQDIRNYEISLKCIQVL